VSKEPGKWIDVKREKRDAQVTVSRQSIEIKRQGKPLYVEIEGTGLAYLLIDCSGSMSGCNLDQARRGASDFAEGAHSKGYAVGLISFDSSVQHLCSPQKGISTLREHLQRMTATGSTNMSSAIYLAAEKLVDKKGTRVIVIVTDGQPDSESATLAAAERAKKLGIDIIAIGTDDANREFLAKIATRSDLAVKVSRDHLGEAITSTAQMLPRLGGSTPTLPSSG
jgi:molecular chaperone DnaK